MSGLVGGTVVLITGTLFTRFNPFYSSGAEDEVVKLLAKQLDRCGPENLKVAPPVEICPYSSLALAFVAGLSTGITACLCFGLFVYVYFRCRVPASGETAPAGIGRTSPPRRSVANADDSRIVVTRTPPRGEHLALGYEELARIGY